MFNDFKGKWTSLFKTIDCTDEYYDSYLYIPWLLDLFRSYVMRQFAYSILSLQFIFYINYLRREVFIDPKCRLFLKHGLAMRIFTGLLCQFIVFNLFFKSTIYGRVLKRTKQLSTVEVTGLIRSSIHICSLTN